MITKPERLVRNVIMACADGSHDHVWAQPDLQRDHGLGV